MNNLYWEKMDEHHYRASIYGGWLVKGCFGTIIVKNFLEETTFNDHTYTLCFVPDLDHNWDLDT